MESAALKLFVRAHELGSISAAARELGWLPATASAALKRAEEDLGGKLFTRTTRSLKATPNGERFLDRARQALAALEEAREVFRSDKHNVQGLVRLSAPADIGEQLVLPALDVFLERYPAVDVALQLSDHVRDIGREDVDAAIRYGTVSDGSLIVRKLVETRRVLVASPSYLERRGVPTRPEELASHECILLKLGGTRADRWKLLRDRRPVELQVRGRRLSDSGAVTRRWALAGHGIALKAWLDVAEDVAQGRLVRVLPSLASSGYPLTLALSSGVRLAGRMRALGDFLVEQFALRNRRYPL